MPLKYAFMLKNIFVYKKNIFYISFLEINIYSNDIYLAKKSIVWKNVLNANQILCKIESNSSEFKKSR